jgi:2-keto-3-deoxy-L-rhamnonate aldolase RhmA
MGLNHEELTNAIKSVMGADTDPTGAADLVAAKGSIVIAAAPEVMKAAFKRIKKVDGYRWVAINREDLFAANTLSLGSKAGIVDAEGKVLKAADLPRKKLR